MMYRGVIFAAVLLMSPGVFADERLDAAVDLYLDEDYSQMDLIEQYAEQGDPMAQGVMGQALWYGIGLDKDRLVGLDWMKSAALAGDRPSATQLGRLYRVGYAETPKSLAEAAKWFVIAAKAGETTTAPQALKDLPRDVVIAAGGEAWAAPRVSETEAAPDLVVPEPPGSSPVTPDQSGKPEPDVSSSASAQDNLVFSPPGTTRETQDEPEDLNPSMQALMDAIFGPGYAEKASPYTLQDGTSFTILTDTALSTTGDLAATCYVVLREKFDADADRLEVITTEMKSGNRTNATEAQTLAESLKTQMILIDIAHDIWNDPARNGGYSSDDARMYFSQHRTVRHNSKTDPTIEDCQSRMTTTIADIALSEANGRFWNAD